MKKITIKLLVINIVFCMGTFFILQANSQQRKPEDVCYFLNILYQDLKRGGSIDIGLEMGIANIFDECELVRNSAFNLLKKLLENNHGIIYVRNILPIGMESNEPSIKIMMVRLARMLVEKRRSFFAAESIARKALFDTNLEVGLRALGLFDELFQAKKSFEVASKIVTQTLVEDDLQTIHSGLAINLLGFLVKHGRLYVVAKNVLNMLEVRCPDYLLHDKEILHKIYKDRPTRRIIFKKNKTIAECRAILRDKGAAGFEEGEHSEDVCSICANEHFLINRKAIILQCDHAFCEFCIKKWATEHKTCPLCRKKFSLQKIKTEEC